MSSVSAALAPMSAWYSPQTWYYEERLVAMLVSITAKDLRTTRHESLAGERPTVAWSAADSSSRFNWELIICVHSDAYVFLENTDRAWDEAEQLLYLRTTNLSRHDTSPLRQRSSARLI
jgi:hypothetical protein